MGQNKYILSTLLLKKWEQVNYARRNFCKKDHFCKRVKKKEQKSKYKETTNKYKELRLRLRVRGNIDSKNKNKLNNKEKF